MKLQYLYRTIHSIADASVYPSSIDLHNKTVNMIAHMWHCPKPEDGSDYAGAGTVGSTEACLLAGTYNIMLHIISHDDA